jgi:glycosyltransferase involved in cell wall biosynthesis
MSARPLISIVTPCYNEEENVEKHYERVIATIAPFREKYDFEHIYMDNCSKDRTFDLLVEMSKKHPNFKVLRFSRNIGGDRSMYFGLQHAKGDAVVLIQSDLQDPPELINDFIKGWEEGYDVVYGQIQQRREGFIIRSCRRLYYWIIAKLSDIPIPQNAGEFRLTSRRALDAVMQFKENDLYMRGAVAQVGFKQKPVQYVRADRERGQSSVNVLYLFGYAINGLLSTTVVPIRVVSAMGAMVAGVGFLFTAILVLSKFLLPGEAPHGFTTLASLITFFSGMQLLAIGVIGEYLRKTYIQSLGRPRGFVQDKIGFE